MNRKAYSRHSARGDDDWATGLAEQRRGGGGGHGGRGDHFDDLDQEEVEASPEEAKGIDVVLDIPVTISMEIGRTLITIRNLLQLNQGSCLRPLRFDHEEHRCQVVRRLKLLGKKRQRALSNQTFYRARPWQQSWRALCNLDLR